jgi:hypothetical protein
MKLRLTLFTVAMLIAANCAMAQGTPPATPSTPATPGNEGTPALPAGMPCKPAAGRARTSNQSQYAGKTGNATDFAEPGDPAY